MYRKSGKLLLAFSALMLSLITQGCLKNTTQGNKLTDRKNEINKQYNKLMHAAISDMNGDTKLIHLFILKENFNQQISKLYISFPKYLDLANIYEDIKLCPANSSKGMITINCKRTLSYIEEIDDKNLLIKVLPSKPLIIGKDYAVVIKLKTSLENSIYQLNAFQEENQNSNHFNYIGSWRLEIKNPLKTK